MELQFHKKEVPCLRLLRREIKEQEQTQEVRLGDSLPDIGRILGAWGQVMIRSKEWHGPAVGVSGGVMVWVLYVPEDGTGVACVDTWIPFRFKWDIPDSDRDGNLLVTPALQSVDARATSARRMVLRAVVGIDAEAVVAQELAVYTPEELPEDIRILRNTYPVMLPGETGEKAFRLEENFSLPADAPLRQVLRCEARTEIADKKVIAGKVVFRGVVLMRLVYEDMDGTLQTRDFEFPFSQYRELERSYGEEATVKINPLVTALELEFPEEGAPMLKLGITGQYTVCDRVLLETVEDAYSLARALSLEKEVLQVPGVLEDTAKSLTAEAQMEGICSRVVDVAFSPGLPRVYTEENGAEISLEGQFNVLYYDEENALRCQTLPWTQTQTLPSHPDNRVQATLTATGRPDAGCAGGTLTARCGVTAGTVTGFSGGLEAIRAITPGEAKTHDPERVGLLLRRAEGESLWEIAKSEGSTVEEIRIANGITGDSVPAGMLLIPVLS